MSIDNTIFWAVRDEDGLVREDTVRSNGAEAQRAFMTNYFYVGEIRDWKFWVGRGVKVVSVIITEKF